MSLIDPLILKSAQDVAYEPIPSVSKKLATTPTIAFQGANFFCSAHSALPSSVARLAFTFSSVSAIQRTIPITHRPFSAYNIITSIRLKNDVKKIIPTDSRSSVLEFIIWV